MTGKGQGGVMPVSEDRDSGGRPRRVNQDMVDHMLELRQKGFTSKDIATEVGVSERTVKRYASGVTPSLQRNLTLDREEMLACLFRWVALLCRHLGLPFEEINQLAVELREKVEQLDNLVIDLLRENGREREIFFIDFIGQSSLGVRYKFERSVSADLRFLIEMNGEKFLPNLVEALRQVIREKAGGG